MTVIDAEALGLLAGALDRDGPDTSPDARAPGDAWLMAELAARLDPARPGPPAPASVRLAQRLARRSRADLRDLMSSPRLEARAVRTLLALDGDDLLPAVGRALTGALALRPEVAAVLAAMILRDAAQGSLPGLAGALGARIDAEAEHTAG
jgi:hypothetical protein